MRIYNYKKGRARRLAVEDDKELVDPIDALGGHRKLTARDRDALADTISFIESGDRGLQLARKAIRESRGSGKGRRSLARASLFAPVEPAVILCSGENYWDHRDEKPVVEGKEPEFFIKLQQCANGPYDDIVYEPKITRKLDYETELAIVIGKGGRHIAKRDAMKHIFGFTVMNDVTARDRQVKMRPDGTSQYALGPGKNFDTSAPLGPCIVTTDELGNPQRAGAPHLGQRRAAPEQHHRDDDLERPGAGPFLLGFRHPETGLGDLDGHTGRDRVGNRSRAGRARCPERTRRHRARRGLSQGRRCGHL